MLEYKRERVTIVVHYMKYIQMEENIGLPSNHYVLNKIRGVSFCDINDFKINEEHFKD